MKWVKTWGPLLVAIIALGLSGAAIYLDNVHYQEVTKPHTEHDEIYNRLARLDDKIERTERGLKSIEEHGGHIGHESWEILRTAERARDDAEKAWDASHYGKADILITKAYAILDQMPPPPMPAMPMNWWLISTIIVGVLIISVIMWLISARRGTE